MTKYSFHVSGTHCAACKILIEDALGEQDFIKNAEVNLNKELVSFETDSDKSPEAIADFLTSKIKSNGYTLSVEKKLEESNGGMLLQAFPIGLLFLAIFFFVQKSGILNFGLGGQITPMTSFVIGLIAP